jgi:hypothetical protein
MGIPYVNAPTEAEARKFSLVFIFDYHILFYLECAALVKEGKVYGVGTEDMDVNKDLIHSPLISILFLGFNIWC